MTDKGEMIKPLTSMRFLFALMVFGSHCDFLLQSENAFVRNLYTNVLSEGYIGVTFFFILSGFILTYRYANGLSGWHELIKFYMARFARIYPVHILMLVLTAVSITSEVTWKWATKLIFNTSLTHAYIPSKGVYFSFNAPSWSISAEMFFYALCPLIVNRLRTISIQKSISVFIGASCLLILTMQIIPNKLHHYIYYISPSVRLLDFILGILSFNVLCKVIKPRFKHFNDWVELLSVAVLIVFFLVHHCIPQVYRFSIFYWLPMCVIVIVFSFQSGVLSGLLKSRLWVMLGEVSFAFYMVHQFVINLFKRFFLTSEGLLIASLLASLTLSYIVFFLYEKPLNRLIRRKASIWLLPAIK